MTTIRKLAILIVGLVALFVTLVFLRQFLWGGLALVCLAIAFKLFTMLMSEAAVFYQLRQAGGRIDEEQIYREYPKGRSIVERLVRKNRVIVDNGAIFVVSEPRGNDWTAT